ncbi:tRNA (guanine(9)-N(1))-methyltransferase [Coemansia sp. RSA 989]|nr:tRNA (guanine(9)-N(1))-methyltransferase [Coemansia sp. RSA 1086]KAJ1753478.1 tRNA (guanine(9)-N(1))-methyltransferase [Coemansia sp. RSA 1821]KAJ1867069.1 tRNA (guanine(9)-N(1))-methyltransferase [Coemansia sp. RSA 989]KAJ1875289.1 tRNA (guanine(9)-N(1))-methyltransferase [Coemansia sp. RSA 990]KAJ2632380.1 tRNA (guanine(9)-N(1))-methyltransferase [Coemansia sp. RSA 1290]KAJ2651656.1 tRNA (guanine(9)-N(1))-methyltransferase [Coemansia sp. RSA 1250]KAJ2676631.1 tRNA (guanine(9)-N(1))-methy
MSDVPASKRHRPEDTAPKLKGPSVDDFIPTTMSMEEFNKLPRNQKKKVMRQEMWDQRSEEFKEKKRIKRSEARKRQKRRIALGEAPAKRKPEDQTRSGHQFVIDMDFDDKMIDKEIKSVCSQVGRCYSANRQGPQYVDLHVTKLHGKCRHRFDTAMADHVHWLKTHVMFHDKEYIDMFDKDKLVYFTADSPNVVETLDPAKVYIIGGIVDKNRYPRLTLDKANEQGIAHAQLPIGDYIQMASRKVITVNQIFEILLKFIEAEDWKSAFLEVIPQRKFKEGKTEAEQSDEGSESK